MQMSPSRSTVVRPQSHASPVRLAASAKLFASGMNASPPGGLAAIALASSAGLHWDALSFSARNPAMTRPAFLRRSSR
jgi:hypothetical protein